MSRRHTLPRSAWFALGAALAVLLVPTTAGAVSALAYTGIEGTSTHKANVTASGQLLTSQAGPSSFFDSGAVEASPPADALEPIYKPPSTQAAIVTSIHVGILTLVSPSDLQLSIDPVPTCSNVFCDPLALPQCQKTALVVDDVLTQGTGTTILPFSPGLVVPSGYELCERVSEDSAQVSAVGYLVPANDAPSKPGG